MDILIKLKDCNLLEIRSDMSTERQYDYYDDYDIPIQYMDFIFSDGTKVNTVTSGEAGTCDFCTVASFFYGKDFTNMTKEQFISSYCSYLGAHII